jgi:hypothetical protein
MTGSSGSGRVDIVTPHGCGPTRADDDDARMNLEGGTLQ